MRSTIHGFILVAIAATPALAQVTFPPDIRLADIASGDITATPPESARDVSLAHLDGDGHLDLFIASGGVGQFSSQPNCIFWGNGDGTFTRDVSAQAIVTDEADSRGFVAADFDMDGDMDIYVANSNSANNTLYLNQQIEGSPRVFSKVIGDPSTLDQMNSRQAAAADVDGDGDLDLYVTNWNNQVNHLFLNNTVNANGSALFVKATALEAGDAVTDTGFSFGITFGDIDDDDDLDLFVANHSGIAAAPANPSTGALNSLYLNDGNGLFTKVVGVAPVLDSKNSLSCCFGDMDGDDDLDLFVGNVQYQQNALYENDGAGNFTQVFHPEVAVDRSHTIDCHWVDLNADGVNELLLANRAGLPIQQFDSLYFRENGYFRHQAFGPLGVDSNVGGDTYGYTVGDINGDLIPDIVGVNFDSAPFVFRNDGRMWNYLAPVGDGGPDLSSDGFFLQNDTTRLAMSGASPNRPAGLVAQFGSVTPVPTPFAGITLLASPVNPPASSLLLITTTDGSGDVELMTHLNSPVISDFGMLFQWVVLDSDAPWSLSATNGLTAVTP